MAPEIECPEGVDDTGAYRIEWSGPDGAHYRLVERQPSGEVDTLYRGDHVASTVSGRPRGLYGYRVGATSEGTVSAWSSWCEVEVEPPTLATALSFFGFGVLVVVATATLVIRGHRAHRRGELS